MSTEGPNNGNRLDADHLSGEQEVDAVQPPKPETLEIVRRRMLETRQGLHSHIATHTEVLDAANFRELTPADLPHVERLYRANEMSDSIFANLAEGAWGDADEEALRGGYIDRWEPTAKELAVIRKHCPGYVPSGEEFRGFLSGEHGRQAVFRAFGVFSADGQNLRAVSAAFIPPREPAQIEAYARQIQTQFLGQSASCQFSPMSQKFTYDDRLRSRAGTTAEWYIIGTDATRESAGAATVAFHRMLLQLHSEQVPITDWFLHHYDSLRLLEPERDDTPPAPHSPNGSSHRFCYRRGFGDCGTTVMANGVAAREIAGQGANGVVVVRPVWRTMWAKHERVFEASQTEFLSLSHRGGREKDSD